MKKLNINQVIKKIGLSFFALFLAFAFTACTNEDTKKEAEPTNEVTDNSNNTNENEKDNQELASTDDSKEKSDEELSNNREIFVTADYVKDVIDGKTDVDDYVIAEATWGEADASKDYLKTHIPGAIHINTDSIEEGPVWNFKSDDEIVNSMLDYGIDKDTTVFIYGPDSGATRVALAYLIQGVENIKVIDGGLTAWIDKGYETEDGENKPFAKDDFKGDYPAHPELLTSIDETIKNVENENSNIQYITTRTYEEYVGETSGYTYIPKAGELPGAIYGHDEADYKNEDGTYLSYDDMVAMLEKEGLDPNKEMVFYCGTGWRAALPVLKFYEKGITTKLFDGGWNEWQMNDELPVQVGDPKEDAKMTTVGELSNDKASKE